MKTETIKIKGARVNNLKNIDLEIPLGKLVVITGVSGSGKSSLAFDTLYAEGQRRYVESLSSYARQFLGRMQKPECDYIKGIPPAIAIEQKVSSRNPRSTVGTSTEIYEYLRLLFARIGHTYSPISGNEVKKQTAEDVIQAIMQYPEGTRFMVMASLSPQSPKSLSPQSSKSLSPQSPSPKGEGVTTGNEDWKTVLEKYYKQGFARVEIDGTVYNISDILSSTVTLSPLGERAGERGLSGAGERGLPYLVIDRLAVHNDKETISRLTDSIETAFYEGHGEMQIRIVSTPLPLSEWKGLGVRVFSDRFEADGMTFEEPSDQLFAFNSPLGACPECEGFGSIIGIDEKLVIPNSSLSLYEGCVQCWRGEKMGEWKEWFIRFNSERGFPIYKPYFELSESEKNWLWHGSPDITTPPSGKEAGERAIPKSWTLTPEEAEWGLISIDAFFDMLKAGQYKIQNRVMLARYRGKTICPKCHGRRLRPEADYVKIGGKTISDLVTMSISDLKLWFNPLLTPPKGNGSKNDILTEQEYKIGKRLLVEINNRLQFLLDVGLPYLTLNRLSNSLSGGESQRINLATSLGSALVGSLYILDEPSIGLHPRDTERLIQVLKQLRDLGNTVIVVEHDEEIMRAADWIIDIGPDAGRLGGQVSASLPLPLSPKGERGVSHTLDYLYGFETIPIPESRRPWNRFIEIKGARANNLKGIDVKIPLNVMTCITGVSGSGKSSLVRDIFYLAMRRQLDLQADRPGEFASLSGDLDAIRAIEFVDQNPIGKSTRSNPVTYVKAWDEIRKLFAEQALAQQMGFTASYFSFNADGGRCEECKGEGTVTVEMQFMADLVLECESCHGKRFKQDILEVRFHEKNVYEILEMTINQAIEFFTEWKEKKIARLLKPLQDVGLGYIKLGQNSSTLSGGENQRVKLAYYLGMEKHVPTLFIFDEPTTGLHFHDIQKLLQSFDSLIDRGHTILIIEHNLDIIKCADHIIDLGPEGGEAGGTLVAHGTPEEVAKVKKSYTGRFLKGKLK